MTGSGFIGIGRFPEKIAASAIRGIGPHLMTVDLPRGASASTVAEPVAAVTVVHDVVTPRGCRDPVVSDSSTGSGKNDRPPFWHGE